MVVGTLRSVLELSGWMCGKRLAPFLKELVPALEEEGALRIDDEVREQLITMSAATIDRVCVYSSDTNAQVATLRLSQVHC